MSAAALAAGLSLTACAHSQSPGSAADLRYCAELSDLYVRYVGWSEAGPRSPVTPDAVGGMALAKCREGDAATAISILGRKLIDAGFTLPPRG